MFEDLEKKLNQPLPQDNAPTPSSSPSLSINPELDKPAYKDTVKDFQSKYTANEELVNKPRKKVFIKTFIIILIVLILVATIFIFKDKIGQVATDLFKKVVKTSEEKVVPDIPEVVEQVNTEVQDSMVEDVVMLEPEIIVLSDTDLDGLLDVYETVYGSDMNQPDTDSDGYRDGEEVINGYSPIGEDKLSDGKNIFYFAYGSNMNLDTMKSRCGESNFVAFRGSDLSDYAFYFYERGFANIKESPGQVVKGVFYKINEDCLNSLDQAEGYPTLYQRRIVKINNNLGNFDSWVYIVENDMTTGNPSNDYYNTVITGAKQYGIDDFYIQYISSLSAQ